MRISLFIAIFVAGFASSCSTYQIEDRDLVKYKEEFAEIVGADKSNIEGIRTSFLTLQDEKGEDGKVVGRCYLFTEEVQIDPRYWYRGIKNEIQRKSLIYHELHHCYCKYEHDDTMMKDNDFCPVSLMHSKTIDTYCLKKHWKHYMKDLKTKCDKSLQEYNLMDLFKEDRAII